MPAQKAPLRPLSAQEYQQLQHIVKATSERLCSLIHQKRWRA
jgi:hypothetical protein